MNLIPKINGSVQTGNGAFAMPENPTISYDPTFERAFGILADRLERRLGIKLECKQDGADILLKKDPSLACGEYTLEISVSSVYVTASGYEGMNHALTTLYHLFVEAANDKNRSIKAVTLRDKPRYGTRGMMIDVCRHFFDADEMKKLIEQMALCKLNLLHWHLSEDQAWRIESKMFPELNSATDSTPNAGHYTHDEILEIIQFAADRGIDVLPEIDMPGHATAMVKAYPHLSCKGESVELAEEGGIYHNLLCAGKDSTFEWLYKMLDEVCELFPSAHIHLGGDESPKASWKACPHCQAKLKELGLENEHQLQGWFITKVHNYLTGKGKKTVCWNDGMAAGSLPGDIRGQYWVDMPMNKGYYSELENGRETILSNVGAFYFDYSYPMIPLNKTYCYEANIKGTPATGHANVLGIEGTIWTERIAAVPQLEANLFPRMQALAECAWTEERDFEDFKARLADYYGELEFGGITATPIEETIFTGSDRIKKSLDYLKRFAEFFGKTSPKDMGMVDSMDQMHGLMQGFLGNFFGPDELPELIAEISAMFGL